METPTPKFVKVSTSGRRATVTWNVPPLNVLTCAALEELRSALRGPAVVESSVLVLRGEGRGWSAGLAVDEHLRPKAAEMLRVFGETLRALWDVPVPTVGQVHGPCLGGGLELLAMCDVAVAAESAKLGQPEIKLGVFPPLAAALFPARMGHANASLLLLTGETLDAAEARRLGLVQRVVPDADLDKSVDELATTLATHKRGALVHLKSAMRASQPSPWPALRQAEEIYLEKMMREDDAEEGLRAFLEKRKPVWRD